MGKVTAVIETVHGTIKLELFEDKAPGHVKNLKDLAGKGFYDGTTFHRIIPGFMIQGGDPFSKKSDRSLHGTGEPGYLLIPEPNDRPHKRGALSMAKMPRETDSSRDFNDNGSQFFICVADSSGLDRMYTVFGEIVRGLDVLDKIVNAPRDERDNPLELIAMQVTVKE